MVNKPVAISFRLSWSFKLLWLNFSMTEIGTLSNEIKRPSLSTQSIGFPKSSTLVLSKIPLP